MKHFTRRLMALGCFALLGIAMAVAQTTTTHIVDRGETLASIAQRYGTTEARIIELNPDAAQYVYVGMELTIPTSDAATAAPATTLQSTPRQQTYTQPAEVEETTTTAQSASSTQSYIPSASTSSSSEERKDMWYRIFYNAISFDSVDKSGTYGFGWTVSPWEIASEFRGGFDFSLGWNLGLGGKDNEGCFVGLGPAFSYYISDNVNVLIPIDVCCSVIFGHDEEGDDKTFTSWGMQIAPQLYLGHKFGIFFGPQLTIGFSKGSDTEFGFRAGIFF
ncbi:MAG: LysM peptidoglycan-binding domain-containing protein [Bacteroidales bacterium]|nr:LysM peptidoglycan-binding domain-containing protein [Bacteroidales bacterium]